MLSIIIPCYNEEEVIAVTYQRVSTILNADWNKSDYEIIFISDGSKDRTLPILLNISEQDPKIRIINFSRNFGHQAAVTAGICNCTGDMAIIIDADLQDPPELFPEMVNLYHSEKCNVINGVRATRAGESAFKKFTAKIFYRFLNNISDVELVEDAGDFRLIDRKVIDTFKSFREKHKYIRGLISWMGFKQCNLHYHRDARLFGKTKYPFLKMLRFAVKAIFYFSKKPLKVALTLGTFSLLVGLALSIYVFYQELSNNPNVVPGWASTVITIIFFGGVQLLTIGVTGEYIGNILDEVKDRPEYIIQDKINFK